MKPISKKIAWGCGIGCLMNILIFAVLLIIGLLLPEKPEGAGNPPEKVPESPKKATAAEVKEAKPVSYEEALAELDALIGLSSVKAEVKKLASFVKISEERRKAGLKVPSMSYHMVFTGNPGTGKTTVARIMAKIFNSLGILKKGHLVETDRSGLVAGYVGQTAKQTNGIIDSALDGILFIDEAYALAEDGGKGYGGEAIATLLKRMEDDRSRLIVVVAGYTEEMKTFIDANPGLKSRFNRYIEFHDYSAGELAEMFRRRVKSNQYKLAPDVETDLVPAFEKVTQKRDRQFGNGRFVRNLFEKAVERQAVRLSSVKNPSPEDLVTLTAADVDFRRVAPERNVTSKIKE